MSEYKKYVPDRSVFLNNYLGHFPALMDTIKNINWTKRPRKTHSCGCRTFRYLMDSKYIDVVDSASRRCRRGHVEYMIIGEGPRRKNEKKSANNSVVPVRSRKVNNRKKAGFSRPKPAVLHLKDNPKTQKG